MKFSLRILTSLVALGPAASLSAASIGFSFNSNRDDALATMDPSAVAGVIPSDGWVSTVGGAGAGDGANGSISNSGVNVDWTSNGTWNTNNGASNGDNQLMNGYADAIGGGGAAQVNLTSLNSLFADGYDIYVYFGSDGNNRTGAIQGPGATYAFNTFSQQGGGFPGAYQITTDTNPFGAGSPQSNYALYSNLSGDSQTFDLLRGSSNAGFHGIQIVGELIPEPSLPMLFGFSGLLVLFRRRR